MTAWVPSFERLSFRLIMRRNFGRRGPMTVAAIDACEEGLRRGVDEATRLEWMREAVRPFDKWSVKRGELS